MPPEAREAIAKQCGSSVNYFRQIAGGHKKPSHKLCRRLVAADPRFDLSALRPDIWPPTENKPKNSRKDKQSQV